MSSQDRKTQHHRMNLIRAVVDECGNREIKLVLEVHPRQLQTDFTGTVDDRYRIPVRSHEMIGVQYSV